MIGSTRTTGQADARAPSAQINELILELWMHAVLGLIVRRTEMTPRAVADALDVTKGAISQHPGVLVGEGYISCRRSDRDGRMQVLELEKHGRAYRDVLRRFEQYTVDRYLARLSRDDLAEVVAALRKLKTAFDD